MSKGRKIILIICLIVFLVSAGALAKYYFGNLFQEKTLVNLKEDADVETVNGLEKLHDRNSDFVGWLRVKGTRIDYPVMQSSTSNPEFYLYRGFNKKSSKVGTPFLDAYSDIDSSYNWLIYGHNIKSGVMFHDLLKYENKSFWQGHKKFTFNTHKKGRAEFEVIAACHTQIYNKTDNVFKYYRYPSITDEKSYNTYVKNVKILSHYNTGITPKFGEQLITLSTCAYHVDNGRFIVVARKVKD